MGIPISENVEATAGTDIASTSDAVATAEEILSQIEFNPVRVITDWSEPPDSMKGTW